MDFTHGFKSGQHDEMVDSLLISPAELAYTSIQYTHIEQTELYNDLLGAGLHFRLRLIYSIFVRCCFGLL